MPIFKGAGVAIVTPMKDNFEVDYERLSITRLITAQTVSLSQVLQEKVLL